MPVSIAMLAASVLTQVVASKLKDELVPTPDQMESGLKRLMSDGLLSLDLGSLGSITGDVLDQVKAAVKKAQGESGGLLSIDSLFGIKTMNWLQFAKRCVGKLDRSWETDTEYQKDRKVSPDFPFDSLQIRYFVEELPNWSGGNPVLLLKQSWENWMKVCGLIASQAQTASRANVIVRVVNIDGPSNILADAHVGPPEKIQLELRFDRAETWNDFKFLATASHEIGHLLGLRHSEKAGQLMAGSLTTISEPQQEDIVRIQKIWGLNTTEGGGDVPEPVIPDPID